MGASQSMFIESTEYDSRDISGQLLLRTSDLTLRYHYQYYLSCILIFHALQVQGMALAGPDSGCDSLSFTFGTPLRYLQDH